MRVDAPSPFSIGGLSFSRRDLTLADARFETEGGTATGFALAGSSLSILSDLPHPEAAAINERIVASLRPARGFGLTDLLSGPSLGLFGC